MRNLITVGKNRKHKIQLHFKTIAKISESIKFHLEYPENINLKQVNLILHNNISTIGNCSFLLIFLNYWRQMFSCFIVFYHGMSWEMIVEELLKYGVFNFSFLKNIWRYRVSNLSIDFDAGLEILGGECWLSPRFDISFIKLLKIFQLIFFHLQLIYSKKIH